MVRSMYAGVTGLRSHQLKMDVTGNNIANVNTYGFKSARITFRDSLYQTFKVSANAANDKGGTNAKQVGYGPISATIDTVYAGPGSFAQTDQTFDCMIGGDGFFLVGKDGGAYSLDDVTALYLTRVGDFDFDANGNLVDGLGNMVYGFGCSTTYTPYGAGLKDLDASLTTVQKLLEFATAQGNKIYNADGTEVQFNADDYLTLKNPTEGIWKYDTANSTWVAVTAANFDSADAGNYYLGSIKKLAPALTVATGAAQMDANTLKSCYTLQSPSEGIWEHDGTGWVEVTAATFDVSKADGGDYFMGIGPGTPPTSAPHAGDAATPIDSVTLNNYLTLQSPSRGIWEELAGTWVEVTSFDVTKAAANEYYLGSAAVGVAPTGVPGDHTPLKLDDVFSVNLAALSALGANADGRVYTAVKNHATSVFDYTQIAPIKYDPLDFPKGLQNLSLDENGFIKGYDAARDTEVDLGRLAIADVPNQGALQQANNSYLVANANTGVVTAKQPYTDGMPKLTSGGLEMAQVDLAKEFSDMIITQRGYQACTKVITTTDEMLNELVNLKR